MTTAKRVHYTGAVQGVGFRYTACALARGYPVQGYVKNLPDGSVELVVEGDLNSVSAFLRTVEEAMQGNIRGQTVTDQAPAGWPDFSILR